jgi:crotonobetainyl-CoA:carnitine CoA-transferase CaiB-like acyl-CoA transferase
MVQSPAERISDQHRGAPCTGMRVIDFTSMVSGPLAGQILGDLGADVIKIEPPAGDILRAVRPQHRGLSAYFNQYNRNKRSLVVDLKSEKGKELVVNLCATADVILENFRPGSMERLGLGYEKLKAKNPRLIYVSITGFGDSGPYAQKPAYDMIIQGLTGLMPVQGGSGKPAAVKSPIVDKLAAMSAALSAVSALLDRTTSGEGQKINVKMLDVWAAFSLPEMFHNYAFPESTEPVRPSPDIYRVFETSDGFAIGLVYLDHQFKGLCEGLKLPELLEDPRFATPDIRMTNIDAFADLISSSISSLTTVEFIDLMTRHGVPFAQVNDIVEFMRDPQVEHNKICVQFEDPKYGPIRNLGFFADFDRTPAFVESRAPELGEHTTEVLRQMGMSDEDIQSMLAEGIVLGPRSLP